MKRARFYPGLLFMIFVNHEVQEQAWDQWISDPESHDGWMQDKDPRTEFFCDAAFPAAHRTQA